MNIIGIFRLYCENLKLRNDRSHIIYPNNTSRKRYVKLPIYCNDKDDVSSTHNIDNIDNIDNMDNIDNINIIDKLNQIIHSIKIKVSEYIDNKYNIITNLNNMNNTTDENVSTLNISNDKAIYMLVNSDDSFESNIIKLGNKSSDYHNTSVTKLRDFITMLRNPKYNDNNNNLYYISNSTLFFNIFIVKKEDNISNVCFRTCIDNMEIYHNKSKYIPFFNPCDKIIVSNNTLVL